MDIYNRQISNIRRILVDNKIVDNSDVVGASPVGAAPTSSSLPNKHLPSLYKAKTIARRDERHLSFGIWCVLYHIFDSMHNCYGCDTGISQRTRIALKVRCRIQCRIISSHIMALATHLHYESELCSYITKKNIRMIIKWKVVCNDLKDFDILRFGISSRHP